MLRQHANGIILCNFEEREAVQNEHSKNDDRTRKDCCPPPVTYRKKSAAISLAA